ncbi:MAG: tetratricopeptide repeat protein [Thermoplasmata archaeon]|nr:tetratricopeptide repeat protein [Thermoplasmata archaeon]
MKDEMAFDLIQKPLGTLDILMYLSRKGTSDIKSIRDELGICKKSFYSATDRLKSLGLVCEEKRTGWPTRVFYQLTYKGEEAVRHLVPFEEMLVESVEAQREELEDLESGRKTPKKNLRMLELMRNLQEASFDLGEWDETLLLSAKAVELASSLEDDWNLSHAYRHAGLVYQKRNDVSNARENLDKSIEISTRTEDWDGASEDHYVLGALYERTGDLQNAIVHYKKSMGYSMSADWKIGEARARLGFGRILGRRGKTEESLREIEQAVKEFEKLDAIHELARAYGDLGATTFGFDTKKALGFFEKSIQVARRTGEIRMRAFGLSNAAACYITKGDIKKALECLGEAENIFNDLDEKPKIASIYIHRGCIHRMQRSWRASEESFRKSIRISEEADAKCHLGDALLEFGRMLSDKGERGESKSVLQRALGIFKELESERKIAMTKEALESLSSR